MVRATWAALVCAPSFAALALGAMTSPAHAQQTSGAEAERANEIIVTAQRRETRLQETPFSVVALGGGCWTTGRRVPGPAPAPPTMSPAPKPSVAPAAEPKRRTRQPQRPGTDLRLLDIEAAARYLGLSASTLNKLRCRGGGPKFLKITRSAVRYDPADLDAWLAARRRGSTSEAS